MLTVAFRGNMDIVVDQEEEEISLIVLRSIQITKNYVKERRGTAVLVIGAPE